MDFRVFKAEDPMVQALIKGEVDFIHDISPVQVAAVKDRKGITAVNGVSPYFEEIGFNTGAVDTETDKPIGDGNPALKDAEVPARARLRARSRAADAERLPGSRQAGRHDRAAGVPELQVGPVRRTRPSGSTSKKAGELLDEAGYKKGDNGLRTMPDGKPIGTLRLFARRRRSGR